MEPNRRDSEWLSVGRMLPGLVLVIIGGLFLLDSLRIVPAYRFFNYWPIILVVIGVVKLVDSPSGEGRFAGGILSGVGAILLAGNLGIFYLTWAVLWPLILISAGLYLLFQRIPWPDRTPGEAQGPDVVNEVAIFGGGKRQITTQDFRGGQITAMFGGVDLDLRQAAIAGDSAVIDINAIFGGANLRIPPTWELQINGAGIFGGYGDETIHPDPRTPGLKRLIIKGSAVFGGVGVKN